MGERCVPNLIVINSIINDVRVSPVIPVLFTALRLHDCAHLPQLFVPTAMRSMTDAGSSGEGS